MAKQPNPKALLDLLHEMQMTPNDFTLWDFRVTRDGYTASNAVHVLARSLS